MSTESKSLGEIAFERIEPSGEWSSLDSRAQRRWEDGAAFVVAAFRSRADEDQPIPEDAAIRAAHPVRTGDHRTYAEALRMVGAKRSKFALVELVNWALKGAPR